MTAPAPPDGPTAGEGPARRPQAARSAYLDALRAVALVRVVVYHASSVWWVATFTAMPLMFFIAGSLFAGSVDRRAATAVVRDRARRILLPYYLYIAAMVALWGALGVLGQLSWSQWLGYAVPVLSVDGLSGPRDPGTGLYLTWFALWYLQMHLVLALVGPLLRRWSRRHPLRLWAGLLAAFALAAATVPPLAIAVFYAACWVVGYAHHDGLLVPWVRRWKLVAAVTGPVGFVGFVVLHGRALPLEAVGVAALGVFWLVVALGLQPRLEPWLARPAPTAAVTWFSQRSLTVYLWHGAVLYACIALPLPGGGSIAGRLAWCAVLLPAVSLAVGWAEDLAARRRPVWWPRPAVDLRTRATLRPWHHPRTPSSSPPPPA